MSKVETKTKTPPGEDGICKTGSKANALLEAATRVFLEHGFTAATTDMIQREAGISKATMYACFPNKEAIFASVIERQCASMTETVKAIQTEPGHIAHTLTALGRAYLELILSPTGLALFRAVVAEAPRFPELGRRFYQSGPLVIVAMVADKLTAAARNNEIDIHAIGAEATARLFISLLRGEALMECLTHPDARPSAAQIDHWIGLSVNAFLAAVTPPARIR